MKKANVKVEIVAIESLTVDPRNARIHTPRSIDAIQQSIHAVGAARSGVVTEEGKILAGNGMYEAAMLAGLREAIVVDADGDRPVFVRRRGLSRAQQVRLALDDNRAQELSAFDPEVVAQLVEEVPSARAGWNDAEWKTLLAETSYGPKAGLTSQDDVPDARATDIRVGDIFELGTHRLLCGDSTDRGAVERLMQGERAGLMNTDPPYGVSYANDQRPNPGVAKPRVANDNLSGEALRAFLASAFAAAKIASLNNSAAWYVWFANVVQHCVFAAAAAAVQVKLHREIIWVKPVLLLGRGQYHWKHEPCFMGWVDGHQPPDYGLGRGERTQTTIWEVDSVTQGERREFNHSAPKPVGLFTIPIVKHLRAGEWCYEPFAGSGPQFIAAEQYGMRCAGIEIEPRYCQVILDRWEAFTGKKAVKVGEAVRGS